MNYKQFVQKINEATGTVPSKTVPYKAGYAVGGLAGIGTTAAGSAVGNFGGGFIAQMAKHVAGTSLDANSMPVFQPSKPIHPRDAHRMEVEDARFELQKAKFKMSDEIRRARESGKTPADVAAIRIRHLQKMREIKQKIYGH